MSFCIKFHFTVQRVTALRPNKYLDYVAVLRSVWSYSLRQEPRYYFHGQTGSCAARDGEESGDRRGGWLNGSPFSVIFVDIESWVRKSRVLAREAAFGRNSERSAYSEVHSQACPTPELPGSGSRGSPWRISVSVLCAHPKPTSLIPKVIPIRQKKSGRDTLVDQTLGGG